MEIQVRQATERDLEAIEALQQATLATNVQNNEKTKEGFVSLETPRSILKKIREQVEIICAFNENDELVGYGIPLPIDIAKDLPFLNPFIERVLRLNFKGEQFTKDNTIIGGQINVRQGYKGTGIAELLHKKGLDTLNGKYKYLVTEVSSKNPRSLYVSTKKLGLDIIKTFTAGGENWYILAQDIPSTIDTIQDL